MADRRGGLRQRKHWHAIGDQKALMTAASTVILGSFTAAGGDPFTVLRLVGEVIVAPDNAGIAADDSCVVGIGFGVVSADAVIVGSSAMPDPIAEPDFNWLWWYQVHMTFPHASGSLVGLATEAARIPIESRAMRKVAPRQSLVMIAEYTTLAGTPPISVLGAARVLVGE